mgnify:CR=1 FL=1
MIHVFHLTRRASNIMRLVSALIPPCILGRKKYHLVAERTPASALNGTKFGDWLAASKITSTLHASHRGVYTCCHKDDTTLQEVPSDPDGGEISHVTLPAPTKSFPVSLVATKVLFEE